MNGYPHSPGFKARDTSRDAAADMKPKAPTLRERVLAELMRAPGTPEMIAARMGVDLMAIRPRFSECSAMGLIEDTGRREMSRGASDRSCGESRMASLMLSRLDMSDEDNVREAAHKLDRCATDEDFRLWALEYGRALVSGDLPWGAAGRITELEDARCDAEDAARKAEVARDELDAAICAFVSACDEHEPLPEWLDDLIASLEQAL